MVCDCSGIIFSPKRGGVLTRVAAWMSLQNIVLKAARLRRRYIVSFPFVGKVQNRPTCRDSGSAVSLLIAQGFIGGDE